MQVLIGLGAVVLLILFAPLILLIASIVLMPLLGIFVSVFPVLIPMAIIGVVLLLVAACGKVLIAK